MLQNVILYLASTAAQVWSALLVFEVIVVRDARQKRDDEIYNLWERSRDRWNEILATIKSLELHKRQHLPEILRDTFVLETMDIRKSSFTTICRAISEHQLVKPGALLDRANYSLGATIQQYVDHVARRIGELESVDSHPTRAFVWGGVTILFNLCMTVPAAIPESFATVHWTVISAILLVNVGVGLWLGVGAYRVVKA